jgi:beta-galactosidase
MKPLLICVLLFSISCLSSCKKNEKFKFDQRELSFNDNWKFIRSDVANAEIVDFDDSGWRVLTLPHDYSIEDLPEKEGVKQIGPFSEESPGGRSTGHVMGGTAWYRKYFTLEKNDRGKIVQILFDGIYMNADVWINGFHLGSHPYGYTAFSYNLTKHLNPVGEKNVLAVQIKNEGQNSRWYSGSGIYRNVKLIKTNPVFIPIWGNYITTPNVSAEKAIVKIETKVENSSSENHEITIKTEIVNQLGETVSAIEKPFNVNQSNNKLHTSEIEIVNPKLWSPENPELYTAKIQLIKNGKILDETRQKFGIRSIEFSPEKGFLLNGNSVLLKGGCLHHDNGILGSAAYETAEYRRVQIMKDNGFNAIRTAHNPPSELFLDACDELGMLVMDESFDHWQLPKNPQDYHLYFDEWWERDMESMLLRDRNHPSIIIWSVGNEIKERADSSGVEILKKLKAKVKQFDTNRPVTQAVCSLWEFKNRPWEDNDAAFEHLDVHGYNYHYGMYEPDFEKFPERIIIGTESFPIEAFGNWQIVKKQPYVIGDFVWTGMDYFGEAAIGNAQLESEKVEDYPGMPWFNAYCGDISILGYKKPQMFYRDVIWQNSDLEMLVHSPIAKGDKEWISRWGWPEEWKSWNWSGNEGKTMQVAVYSNYEEIRLELNGEVIGAKKVSEETKLTARFELEYQPGELVAIGLKDGKEIARQSLKTTGKPVEIKITAEQDNIPASANHLVYFNVEVLDEQGLLIPNAEIPVEFNIQGKCKLQAVGNGNPKDMKSFQQPKANTFRGRCQLIVRSCEDGDEIVVTAKSEGLKTGEAKVFVQN